MQEERNLTLTDITGIAQHESAPSTVESMKQADQSYQVLRRLVAEHVTAALQADGLLLRAQYSPIALTHWRRQLPKVAQQHYQCQRCENIWDMLGRLCVLDNENQLHFPIMEAFRAAAATDKFAAATLHACEQSEAFPFHYTPMAHLEQTLLVERVVGGFEHFYGVTQENKALLDTFNSKHTQFKDAAYVTNLFHYFNARELDVDVLEKVFVYISREIGAQSHTALGHNTDLVKVIRRMRSLGGKGNLPMAYLGALLSKNDHNWLRHVNGSVLGVVLKATKELRETDSVESVLLQVKTELAKATAGENYKQKTAEAPQAALQQAYQFLATNNLKGTLERRLMALEEARSILWQSTADEPEAGTSVETPSGTSAVDAAFEQLTEKKDRGTVVKKELDGILGNIVVDKSCSKQEFVARLSEFKSIALAESNQAAFPVFVLTAATEGDHDQLLNFDKTVGEYATLLSTPTPHAYHAICRLVPTSEEINMFARRKLAVDAVLLSQRITQNDPTYVLHLPGFALNFAATLVPHGSCVLGSNIKSEHFGMSRALVELSQMIPLDTSVGHSGIGGVMLDVGLVLEVELHDGTKEKIKITSTR